MAFACSCCKSHTRLLFLWYKFHVHFGARLLFILMTTMIDCLFSFQGPRQIGIHFLADLQSICKHWILSSDPKPCFNPTAPNKFRFICLYNQISIFCLRPDVNGQSEIILTVREILLQLYPFLTSCVPGLEPQCSHSHTPPHTSYSCGLKTEEFCAVLLLSNDTALYLHLCSHAASPVGSAF